jgi:hypothetical protein
VKFAFITFIRGHSNLLDLWININTFFVAYAIYDVKSPPPPAQTDTLAASCSDVVWRGGGGGGARACFRPWSSGQSPNLPTLPSAPCPAFPRLQYEPPVIASRQAKGMVGLTPASPSSRWLFLLFHSLFSTPGYRWPPCQVSVTVSDGMTVVPTLPAYRSSIPAALRWWRPRSRGGLQSLLASSLVDRRTPSSPLAQGPRWRPRWANYRRP